MAKVVLARTVRQDPAQEKLVQRKDRINDRVKELINLLIETKRSWNGKPAPGIGINESHSIKEPIPKETSVAMDKVVQLTQEVSSELNGIIQEQDIYSNTRRKPQPKVEEKHLEPNQTSVDLSSIASSGVSRFISHVKAPFQFGDSNKWRRLKLLR